MRKRDYVTPKRAISAILRRYRKFVVTAAMSGTEFRIVTAEDERPNLTFDGDGQGRAMMAICTEDGYRHIVFSRWPDGDTIHPENWPECVPVPDCRHDPLP